MRGSFLFFGACHTLFFLFFLYSCGALFSVKQEFISLTRSVGKKKTSKRPYSKEKGPKSLGIYFLSLQIFLTLSTTVVVISACNSVRKCFTVHSQDRRMVQSQSLDEDLWTLSGCEVK